ncbi:exo-alpha-sialidase [Phytoactinopolyspora endophytica]|uniref:golvesin C-terminal-like domain-containing protein n=1 Tax=Phytoactinopolyspora endophytica TaxID=1642495 RepID=UPI00101BB58B|nr:exo-alpha-sialidase [Phytoactinopolyspora endophytica]
MTHHRLTTTRRTVVIVLSAALLAAGSLTLALPSATTGIASADIGMRPAERGMAQAASSEHGWFEETTLWDSETGSHENYHVHALAVTPDDTILAFTEGRYELSDGGSKDILLRRSTDGGDTWEPTQAVVPSGGRFWSSPTALVDDETGSAFLIYQGPTSADINVISSDDSGASWSDPVSLSHLFEDNPFGWILNGPGPGHGIQLEGGRLILPILHRRSAELPAPERRYGIDTLYSDDHGKTWQRGGRVPVSPGYPINESRLYQRDDGAVVVNGRAAAGGHRLRISSVSTDDGLTWSDPVLEPATGRYTAVDSSVVSFDGPDGMRRTLQSRPDSARRENLTVAVSYDDGYTYRYEKALNPGPSYYSDLAVLSDGTVIVLYGRDGEILAYPQRVALARFDLAWLTDGRDDGTGIGDRTGNEIGDEVDDGPQITEHAFELGTMAGTRTGKPSGTRAGSRTESPGPPHVVDDANARGSKALGYDAAAPGDYVEMPVRLPRDSGEFEAAVRLHRSQDLGKVQVSIDGENLPDGLVDPTLETGEAYQTYQLGAVELDRGLHWVRFTLVDEGHLGGSTIAPDELTLIDAGGVPNGLVRDVVVDDESVDAFERSGTWGRATGQEGHPYYGVSYRSAPAGSGDRIASWRPDVPVTGTYNVLAWYVSHPNRASDAAYTVHHADGSTTVEVDQRGQARSLTDPGRPGVWVDLGSFPFEAGTAATVELSNDADGYVIADAITLTRDPVPATPTDLQADPASPSRTELSWTPSDGATGYHVERRPNGDGAWEFAGEVPGDETTFTSTGLSPDTTYEHRIYAITHTEPGRPPHASAATDPTSP